MTDLERYKHLLATHDWGYQYSDDYGAWLKGKQSWESIVGLGAKLDPDWAIFNQYIPEAYKKKDQS